MSNNKNLHRAKKEKNDEFYTQITDIENELKHYKKHFENKVVFCNCDDPYESNFFKYFAMNFNHLKLKKLIATCYDSSPISYTQLNLFGEDKSVPNNNRHPYKIEINEVQDYNNDGATDLVDGEYLLKRRGGENTALMKLWSRYFTAPMKLQRHIRNNLVYVICPAQSVGVRLSVFRTVTQKYLFLCILQHHSANLYFLFHGIGQYSVL